MDNITHSVWVGLNDLSLMERLTLTLLVKNGYNPILWCNNEMKNVPDGVTLKQIPKDIIQPIGYRGKPNDTFNGGIGSYALWADYFSFYTLYMEGGLWVQMDVAITNPIVNEKEYWFNPWANGVGVMVLKMPKGNIICKDILNRIHPHVLNGFKGSYWEVTMELLTFLIKKHKIIDQSYIFGDEYIDCGGNYNSIFRNPSNKKYQIIHWSNATHITEKNNPIIGSEYYRLCLECGLIDNK
jgi:hypothetical protein